MKRCTKCLEFKKIDCFYAGRSDCKACKKARVNQYRTSNPQKVKQIKKKYHENNKESILLSKKIKYREDKEEINFKRRQEYKSNPERHKQQSISYYYNNKDKCLKRQRKINKKHYQENKDYYYSKSAERRARKIQATPYWADLEKIQKVYEKVKWLESITGLRYEVDHVIPLNGEKLCGLHVWENLQILESSLNKSKSNKVLGIK